MRIRGGQGRPLKPQPTEEGVPAIRVEPQGHTHDWTAAHVAECALSELRLGRIDKAVEEFAELLDVTEPYEDFSSLRSQLLVQVAEHPELIERLVKLFS